MKKETFVLHTDLYDKTLSLSNEEFGHLMRKVFLYVKKETLPKLNDKLELIFEFIKVDIDKNLDKYEKTCKKRQESIRKRWNNNDDENVTNDTKDTNVYKSIKSIQNDYDNHNHNHIHNHKKEKKDNKGMGEEEKKGKKQLEAEFEELWQIYPNKKGKQQAMQKYSLARKQGATYEEVRQGLEHYIKYCKTIDKKYIKHGSTWFNQKCLQDEYIEEKNIPGWFEKNIVDTPMTPEEELEMEKALEGLFSDD